MGKGRKPVPSEVRKLLGTRSRDGYGVNEPLPGAGVPATPPHLTGIALGQWHLLVEVLTAVNVLHKIDGAALEGACVNYARAVEADEHVAQHGICLFTKNNEVKKNPACTVSRECWSQYRSFCSELGLTPAARARVKFDVKPKTESKFDSLTKKK